jgi:hypothetical protein
MAFRLCFDVKQELKNSALRKLFVLKNQGSKSTATKTKPHKLLTCVK